MARQIAVHDPDLGPLTRDRLTRDYVVYQRASGHRFSVDDVATAWVACRSIVAPRRILDLGCGLGSVLLHLAWHFRESTLVGIEAQQASFELVGRNVRENGLEGRIEIVHGDINDAAVKARAGSGFDLVTGTPPYFPERTATDANDAQRAFARIEYRGGVESYIAAAAGALARGGRFVVCGASESDARVLRSATEHGMHVIGRMNVVASEGRAALFTIWTIGWDAMPFGDESITIRDRDGRRTEAARALTRFSGFEPRE